jgi:hypothetical protein
MERQLYLGSREVVAVTQRSHIHEGVTPPLLREALSHIRSFREPFIAQSLDLGRTVGYNHCVLTNESDEIRYARRPKRKHYSRFVLNREPVPCSSLVVVLQKSRYRRARYELVSSYIGDLVRLPGVQSTEFWMQHALVLGDTPIDERSVRVTPPEKWMNRISSLPVAQ